MFTCKYHSCNSTESMLLQGLPRWLSGKRIHLPMQETQVPSLILEDPTFCGAAMPLYHNC